MNITPEYIAGFIDGEGYFGLVRKMDSPLIKIKHRDNHYGYYYTPVLKISQVTRNDEVLKAIKNFIGYGNLSVNKISGDRKNPNNNCSNKSSLEFRGMTRVIPIAKKLLPYLIVKERQAKLIIKLEETQVEITNVNRESINKARTDIYKQLKILNQRGLAETKRSEPKGMQ